MRFQDRIEAGQLLATKLSAYANKRDVVVVALPRGGVPVGFEVAKALKLGVPSYEELGMGAIAYGGFRVLNDDVVRSHNVSSEAIDLIAHKEQRVLEAREHLYHHNRPAIDLVGSTVIVVDDGMATGSTMHAAVLALRQIQLNRIIVAVPVAEADTWAWFRAEVEVSEMISLKIPVPFYAVSYWYENFAEVRDKQVKYLLELAALRQVAVASIVSSSMPSMKQLGPSKSAIIN
jgi:putative phosphoribosyl transferase